jgi:hypothetical protein
VTYQEVSHAKLDLVCRTFTSCSCVFPQEKGEKKTLDSLEWSKKYEILSISRLDLRSFGLTTEQINSLSDADMEVIAEKIAELVVIKPIEKIVEFVARLYLVEKGTGATQL